jgi:hypothetical protein
MTQWLVEAEPLRVFAQRLAAQRSPACFRDNRSKGVDSRIHRLLIPL